MFFIYFEFFDIRRFNINNNQIVSSKKKSWSLIKILTGIHKNY